MFKTLVLVIACLGTPLAADDILVFAAASLKGPLDQIAAEAGDVVVSYGGSGTLARQISLGAPADVVILASTDWMDILETGGHVLPESRADILGNHLVVLAAKPEPLDLTVDAVLTRLDGGRLAMGFVASVPAGIYGKAALTHLGLWDRLSPHVAEVDNVRAAVALVARKEAPLAIGYASDAALVDGVFAVARFPADSHEPIRYPAAAVTAEGLAFLDRLHSPQAQEIFAAAGFQKVAPE
ncbi:molybdate transport system substrate-binding protein [Cognatiyoonia koreensis]|uniref:Molybdate transport system substrate-binding protein n=1 Tax=Cognatiyoonia koreensis TaxID=364200 RepID=A0A1I0MSD5_9RHOB|nr:molybdate ABC transporter substrate-binding protein [Cognatiyoonia koreensis]SEV90821.1 molybdate transport system substrate-binding protein [Cognatiyoonia koreensis]